MNRYNDKSDTSQQCLSPHTTLERSCASPLSKPPPSSSLLFPFLRSRKGFTADFYLYDFLIENPIENNFLPFGFRTHSGCETGRRWLRRRRRWLSSSHPPPSFCRFLVSAHAHAPSLFLSVPLVVCLLVLCVSLSLARCLLPLFARLQQRGFIPVAL